ncbi:MAG: LacI family transcriptional regulator [Pirellulaceae bacterium]|nr:LacI family transcriptional regulator [Pirellulaceae bacterium]
MKRPPTITLKRIADQLGISVTTVSRALGGQARRYRISRETEQSVKNLARSLDFSPNQLARGLRLKKTSTIGLVIPDVSNPFFATIVRQIALGARNRGYSLIICDSQDSEKQEIESLGLLRGRGVEGIVLCPVGLSAGHLAKFEEGDLPLVLVDRYFPGLRLPYVASDNFGGAGRATTYLLDKGHRRIACLQGLQGTSPNEDRLRGYRAALSDHGIPADDGLIAGDSFGEQGGYVTTKLLLKTAPDFTAIFAFSNLISLGAIRALSEEGLRVPEDVSIVSFDDQPYAAYLAAPMTTVAQPTQEMGEIAVRLLFDRIRAPRHVVQGGVLLPTNLMERSSVRDLAIEELRKSERSVINDCPNHKERRRVCG